MENKLVMMKGKLEFLGIVKEAFKIPIKTPNFILMFLLTSFPLFCFLLLHEIIFQHSLIEAINSLTHPPPYHGFFIRSNWQSFQFFRQWVENIVSTKLVLQSLLFLGFVHLFDLLNTIITVYTASVIYAEENQMNLKEMLSKPIKEVGFKGPLITSIYALVLGTLTLIGFLSLSVNFYVTPIAFLKLILALLFMVLLTKYIEWSAIWNMGIVLSILEEKHGDIALGVSAYLSRGSRKRGFLLMLVFFAWSLALRLSSLYIRWQKGGSGNVMIKVIVGQMCLHCLGNVIKWVAFMIYFVDCKRRFLEKKFDGAEGRA